MIEFIRQWLTRRRFRKEMDSRRRYELDRFNQEWEKLHFDFKVDWFVGTKEDYSTLPGKER